MKPYLIAIAIIFLFCSGCITNDKTLDLTWKVTSHNANGGTNTVDFSAFIITLILMFISYRAGGSDDRKTKIMFLALVMLIVLLPFVVLFPKP